MITRKRAFRVRCEIRADWNVGSDANKTGARIPGPIERSLPQGQRAEYRKVLSETVRRYGTLGWKACMPNNSVANDNLMEVNHG